MPGQTTDLQILEPTPSPCAVITSSVFSALRYGSMAALAGIFIVADRTGHLKRVALSMVSPDKVWMPTKVSLCDAFSFICGALALITGIEAVTKLVKNCSTQEIIGEHQVIRSLTSLEKAAIAAKTIYNLGSAVISAAAAYYCAKFMGLFLKAAIALKGHHLLKALKDTGKALNMSSIFSKVFSWIGIAHAAKGVFKTCASVFLYCKRRGQANRPTLKKIGKQSVKTALKIAAAVGGIICASTPVIGWILVGVASTILTVWSLSKFKRLKKAQALAAEQGQAEITVNADGTRSASTSATNENLDGLVEPSKAALPKEQPPLFVEVLNGVTKAPEQRGTYATLVKETAPGTGKAQTVMMNFLTAPKMIQPSNINTATAAAA